MLKALKLGLAPPRHSVRYTGVGRCRLFSGTRESMTKTLEAPRLRGSSRLSQASCMPSDTHCPFTARISS